MEHCQRIVPGIYLSPFAETSLEFKGRMSDTLHTPLKSTDAEPQARGSSAGMEKTAFYQEETLSRNTETPPADGWQGGADTYMQI